MIFDCQTYYKYNPDLSNMNTEQLINHWENCGLHENRICYKPCCMDNFSHEIYKLLHDDLADKSNLELEMHFIRHGIFENRIYSVDTFLKNNELFDNDVYAEKKIIEYLRNKNICVKLIGGLGNQLFMLLNALSISDKNNMNCYIHEKYEDAKRNAFYNYSFFKNINTIKNHDRFDIFNETNFIYSPITIDKTKNYLLNGYFQSYKYFWDNRASIKKQIFIDENIVGSAKSKLDKFKKIIAIHLRLGDYLQLPEYHPTMPIKYYEKALSYYNLNNHQIILFSDDYELANDKLKCLNLNYINANQLFENDEEEFYALCFSDIRICANSSFSLMSCYFTEIFEFKENCEYIFPNLWFGIKGPNYCMDDLIPNYKFFVIDLENITYDVKYDIVTTIHSKDKNRYEIFNKYNKKNLINGGKMYYVSYKDFNNDMNYISEKLYPFTKQNVVDYIKNYIPEHRWGWYYQQLLKLYIFKVHKFETENVLIFDSDILLLKQIHLFDGNNPKIFKRLTGDKKIHVPYLMSIKYIINDLYVNENDSGISHMMIFNKKILDTLFDKIENFHKKPLWKICLDSAINYINIYGYNMSILSEYELYYNYVVNYFPDEYVVDKNMKYLDIAYCKFDFYRNKNKYYYIADHHYQSKNEGDEMVDNLIDINGIIENVVSVNEIADLKLNGYVNYLLKTYSCKDKIQHYEESVHTDDKMLTILFNKLLPSYNIFDIIHVFYNFNYTRIDVVNIVRTENYILVKKLRNDIDNIISDYLTLNYLKHNTYVKNIIVKNVNLKTDKYYFGIVVPVFNRYYITKIFLECLKMNVNFESVIFCFVDDGSEDDVLNELNKLNLNTIIIQCDRKNNIYGSNNTSVPGSLYPLTLYMGHEIIKNNCKLLGVLDSDAFINENYFNECKLFTQSLNMDNVIFSGFNSHSDAHKIYKTSVLHNKNIVYKNMVGGISQFYSVKLYEQFKYKFTGEESHNYWAYDYDYQISDFIKKSHKQYICLKESNVQHIGINTTMIRNGIKNNNDTNNIIDIVYKILKFPAYRKTLQIEFDFDENFIGTVYLDKIFENLNYSYKLNTFVDKIYYINLDERTDRKIIMEKQFKDFNIQNYERICAVKPCYNDKYSIEYIDEQIELFLNDEKFDDNLFIDIPTKYIFNFSKDYIRSKSRDNRRKYILGALGCKLSHKKIFELCKTMPEHKNILLLEDDAKFCDNFIKIFNGLHNNLELMDFNYDMVWLCPNWVLKNNGGVYNRCYSYKHIYDDFAQISPTLSCDNMAGSTQNAAGLLINGKIINNFVDTFDLFSQNEIDLMYRMYVQKNGNTYTTIPNLITQRNDKSNIEEFSVNYTNDIHYKTRAKFNIFTILKSDQKDIYYSNLINNLTKMIGYENIYYVCDTKLFDNDILRFIDIKTIPNTDVDNINNLIPTIINDNNINYFYNMDANEYFIENFYPFDENNNLIATTNFYTKFCR